MKGHKTMKITKETFKKTLAEVTRQPTVEITKKSSKSGSEYKAEIIKTLHAYAVSAPIKKNEKYSYSVIDTTNDLEYSISAPNHVDAKFTTPLEFTNVSGGLLDSGIVWFSAESVKVISRNA